MVEVRKHQRRTASGRLTTVRRHTRDAGGSHPPGTWYGRDDETGLVFAVHPDGTQELLPAEEAEGFQPIAPSGPPPAAPVQARREEFWDDDPEPEGEWWDRTVDGEVQPGPPPQWPAPAGWDEKPEPEPEAAVAYREAGYDGPVDQDGNPTDLKALKKARKEIERERRHVQFKFMQAPTRAERDAVQEEDRPLAAKLKVLEDPRERRRQERARQARKDLYQKLS